MTVELDRDDLVNLIIGCSGPYYTMWICRLLEMER